MWLESIDGRDQASHHMEGGNIRGLAKLWLIPLGLCELVKGNLV